MYLKRKFCFLIMALCYSVLAYADGIPSDSGTFRISFAKPLNEIPLHKIVDADFSISTPQGAPVPGLQFDIEAGMPGHGHGMPTSPFVEERSNGHYTLRGVSFSMRGEWLLVMMIKNGRSSSDRFTLPINITP